MFKDILSFFKSKDENGKAKKISPFIILLCSIIIIVPTTIALLHAYLNDDTESVVNNTVEISFSDFEGTQLATEEVVESNIQSSEFAKMFYNIISNKKESSAILTDKQHNFKLIFKYNGAREEYLCYFTDSYATSYLKDSRGIVFSLAEEDYNVFLNSEFSHTVYPYSQPPKLITADGEAVLPTNASWNYLKQNKESVASVPVLAPSSDATYNISGAINLHFEQTPNFCVAQIFDDNGEMIYEGTLGVLSELKAQTNVLLRAKISAVWENKEGCSAYGEATYTFNIILGNKAEFSLSKSKVVAGDFLIISIKNANNLSKIIYSSKKEAYPSANESITTSLDYLYSYKPKFVIDNQFARAILPFPANIPAGTFEFSIAYGAAEQDFSVELEERTSTEPKFSKLSTQIAPIISSESLSAFKSILTGLKTEQSKRLFRGHFLSPSDDGLIEGYSFNDKVKTSDGLSAFTAVGNEFLSPLFGGTPIRALNIGVIAEASYCTFLGNYVVVDHGMGLYTWYCGLSDFNVSVGDIVAKGDSVGKSGTGSLLSSDGTLILCSVYDTLIAPDVLWNSQFEFDTTAEPDQQ